jgi:hypothetical protein
MRVAATLLPLTHGRCGEPETRGEIDLGQFEFLSDGAHVNFARQHHRNQSITDELRPLAIRGRLCSVFSRMTGDIRFRRRIDRLPIDWNLQGIFNRYGYDIAAFPAGWPCGTR